MARREVHLIGMGMDQGEELDTTISQPLIGFSNIRRSGNACECFTLEPQAS